MTKASKLGVFFLVAVVAFEAWLFTDSAAAAAILTALVLAGVAVFFGGVWLIFQVACLIEAAIRAVARHCS